MYASALFRCYMDEFSKKIDELKSGFNSLVDAEVSNKLDQIIEFIQSLKGTQKPEDKLEPRYKDVEGNLRLYKKNCLHCGTEFATDFKEREFCSRGHLISYEDGKNNSAYQEIKQVAPRKHIAMRPEVKNSTAGMIARSEAQQTRRSTEKRLGIESPRKRPCLTCSNETSKGPYCSDKCRKEMEAQLKSAIDADSINPSNSVASNPVMQTEKEEVKLTPKLPPNFDFVSESEKSQRRILEKRLGISSRASLTDEAKEAIERVKSELKTGVLRPATTIHRPRENEWGQDNDV